MGQDAAFEKGIGSLSSIIGVMRKKTTTHKQPLPALKQALENSHEKLRLPSNRSFGALFVVVLGLVAAYSWWRGGAVYPWAFGLSALILLVTLAKPAWLEPANRAWMKLARLLHRIVSPIVLGVLFYGIFTPVAWVMRLSGRDAMKRRFEPAAHTYWVERNPPGPDPDGLPKQF